MMQALFRTGDASMGNDTDESKAIGGFARADALTPTQRKAIARKAAAARWSPSIPTAIKEGVIKIGKMEIPCAVLADGRRVLTQSGFMLALGRARQAKGRQYYKGDVNLPAFLTAKNLNPYVTENLKVTSSQIEFKTIRGNMAFGYAAELLPQVCEVFLQASDDNKLTKLQLHIGERARILIRGLASTGIVALVDEATGYQDIRPQQALQAYLEKIIRKELAAWVKRFPDEFYENIYKLKGWTWPGIQKNRYSVVAYYTRDLVYERVAPGVLRELEQKEPRNEKGRRVNKLHQWLTEDIGHPLLAQHLHSLIMFQRLALKSGFGWHRFVKMVDQVMPKRGTNLELFPEPLLPSS
jgi:hypothetical protein